MADEGKPDDEKPAGETKPPAPAGEKPPADTEKPAGDSGSGDDNLRKIVAEEIKKALGERPAGSTLPTPRARDIEEEAKRMVREAAAKLKEEEKHEKDHAELAEQAKKAVEAAPKKVRRLTKALWGEED